MLSLSALQTVDIRKLLRQPKPHNGASKTPRKLPLRPGDLLEDQVAAIHSPDFPGECLLVCLNSRLRSERARKRDKLLQVTEQMLHHIASMVDHGTGSVRGRKDTINRRVGRDTHHKLVEKQSTIEVTDRQLTWSRKRDSISQEALLDGIYVVRASLTAQQVEANAVVTA